MNVCYKKQVAKIDLIISCEIFMGMRCEYCYAYLDDDRTKHLEEGGSDGQASTS